MRRRLKRDKVCWLIRSNNDDEVIGITTLSWRYAAIKEGVYKALGESVGHRNWHLDLITEVEYETYKEFGFEEFKI